jgi:hypothetical protein
MELNGAMGTTWCFRTGDSGFSEARHGFATEQWLAKRSDRALLLRVIHPPCSRMKFKIKFHRAACFLVIAVSESDSMSCSYYTGVLHKLVVMKDRRVYSKTLAMSWTSDNTNPSNVDHAGGNEPGAPIRDGTEYVARIGEPQRSDL